MHCKTNTVSDESTARRAYVTVTNAHGVPPLSSALRSSTTCRGIRSAAAVTGTTVLQDSVVLIPLTTVHSGPTASHVCAISCVAGARLLIILPLVSATTETSQVCCFVSFDVNLLSGQF